MADTGSDIEKYKRGELSAREMHALEKKALHDPFLADALEGLDSIGANTLHDDLAELDKKFVKKKSNTATLWIARIAASAIIVMGGAWLALEYLGSPKGESMALESSSKSLATDSIISSEQPQPASTISEQTKETMTDQVVAEKPSTTQPKKTEPSPTDLIETNTLASAGTENSKPIPIRITDDPTLAPSPSIAKTEEKEEAADAMIADEKIVPKDALRARKKIAETMTTIKGRVTSVEDGSPLPGVNVVLKGTSIGAITDINGHYLINAPADQKALTFSFIGFQTQEVVARDTATNVQLGVDATQLSEVVVVGYGYAKTSEPREPIVKLAEPVGGRKAYDNYLQKSLRYPQQALDNKIKGRVTVQFTVRTDGSVDEFNVLKSLGYGCDEEVIRLVKDGPKWSPTTEDNVAVESEVRVKVRFSLPD